MKINEEPEPIDDNDMNPNTTDLSCFDYQMGNMRFRGLHYRCQNSPNPKNHKLLISRCFKEQTQKNNEEKGKELMNYNITPIKKENEDLGPPPLSRPRSYMRLGESYHKEISKSTTTTRKDDSFCPIF